MGQRLQSINAINTECGTIGERESGREGEREGGFLSEGNIQQMHPIEKELEKNLEWVFFLHMTSCYHTL